MPHGVSCAVNSCTFWEEDNKCNADAIHIQTDYAALLRQARKHQDSEFAAEFEALASDVRHSIDTCCQTYKPKDEADEHE